MKETVTVVGRASQNYIYNIPLFSRKDLHTSGTLGNQGTEDKPATHMGEL